MDGGWGGGMGGWDELLRVVSSRRLGGVERRGCQQSAARCGRASTVAGSDWGGAAGPGTRQALGRPSASRACSERAAAGRAGPAGEVMGCGLLGLALGLRVSGSLVCGSRVPGGVRRGKTAWEWREAGEATPRHRR